MNVKTLMSAMAVAVGLSAQAQLFEVTTNRTVLTTGAAYEGVTATETESYLGTFRAHTNRASKVGTQVEVNVGSGKTLTIDRFTGGRGTSSTATKTGAGTLRLGDARKYGGTIILNEGTLDLSKRTVPTKAELPENPFLHLDASDPDAFTTEQDEGDPKTYVKFWKNDGVGEVNGEKVTGLEAYMIWKYPKYFRPWLIKDAFGPGKHAIDFGSGNDAKNSYNIKTDYTDEKWAYECGGFVMVTNENYEASTSVAVGGFKTVIALVGAQKGGGYILAPQGYNHNGRPFSRGSNWVAGVYDTTGWKNALAQTYTYKGNTNAPSVFLDGREVPETSGYESPNYHTFAIRQDPSDIKINLVGIGTHGNGNNYLGCFRVSEMFVYDRFLTDDEIKDVEAYLAKKWLNDLNPGYREAEGQAEIAAVQVDGEASIYVPEGETARIGKLTVNNKLTKTGAGRLEVFEYAGDGQIVFNAGEIFVADKPDSGDQLAAIAPGASFYLNASVTNSMTFNWAPTNGAEKLTGGTQTVHSVVSMNGRNAAYAGSQPFFIPDALNGQPLL